MSSDLDLKPGPGALERAQNISQALADAARRARFSSRSRRAMSGGGFGARAGARLMRLFVWSSFVLLFALPSLAAAGYFLVIASDQYVAMAKFTVMGGVVPVPDGIAKTTGIPAAAIVQDTQVVVDYLQSRAAVEDLQKRDDLKAAFSKPTIDYFSRFNPSAPVEKLARYWRKMLSVSIGMPAGVVTMEVRAFSPQDAVRIAQDAVASSEALINDLNARLNAGEVATAEREFKSSADRLAEARSALEKARNASGLLSATAAADALGKLITEVRGQMLTMQREYQAHLSSVSADAPEMKQLKLRIEAAEQQVSELEAKITAAKGPDAALTASLSQFSELDLENKIAERLYAGAAATLELAKLMSEHQLMYLNVFVDPALPQEPTYPRRILDTVLVCGAALALWGALVGLMSAARNHMAR